MSTADARNAISLVGIRPLRVTLNIDNSTITPSSTAAGGSTVINRAVTLSADNTVALAGAGEKVIGKLISVNPDSADLRATVQVGGFMTLPKGDNYGGSPGLRIVGDVVSAAKGYVKHVPLAGGSYSQAEVNLAQKANGTIYDDSDSALVLVHLAG